MSKRIVIIGAGGHGKVVADLAKLSGYEDIIFLDDNLSQKRCGQYFVQGDSGDINKYSCDFIVAVGNSEVRKRKINELDKNNKNIVSLIHPRAVVAESVTIGRGSVVMAGAVINADASIGEGCIINTCASVDHDCKVGNYVHISVGAHVSGTVTINENTWIGAGATVINNLDITANCIVGAGALVVKDIVDSGVYVGVPVKKREK